MELKQRYEADKTDKMETKQSQDGDKTEIRWRRNRDMRETKQREDGDETDEGDETKPRWK